MNIKIEAGANVQITDKPIVNINGDLNYNEINIYSEANKQDAAEMTSEEVKDVDEYGKQTPPVVTKTPVEVFVAQVKRIMLLAEKKKNVQKFLFQRNLIIKVFLKRTVDKIVIIPFPVHYAEIVC